MSALADRLIRSMPGKGAAAFFITSTDTGVGKTFLICELLKEFRRREIPAIGFKPICCGDRRDVHRILKSSNRKMPLDVLNPVHLPFPVAPVSQVCPPWKNLLQRIRKAFYEQMASGARLVLVEGAGGLLCPITYQRTMRELAQALDLPLVVVVPDRLGVLNHTLLTLEAATTKGLTCVAVVLNRHGNRKDASRSTNGDVLKRLLKIPVHSL